MVKAVPFRAPAPRTAVLVLALAALSAPARAEEESCSVRGDHFRVVLDFDDPETAAEALRTVEALWPVARSLYDLPEDPLPEPLAVHLYRWEEGYERAEKELTGGALARNLAMAHHDTSTAHVALQPPVSDETLKRLGLPGLTRRMLLHEAAHLLRYSVSPAFRSHPDWLADGVAMRLSHATMEAGGWSPPAEGCPYRGGQAVRLRELLDQGRLPDLGAVLRDETAGLPFYDRYAVHGRALDFLLDGPGAEDRAFAETLRAILRLPAGPRYGLELHRLVAAGLEKGGGEEKLSAAFHASVRDGAPRWEEVLRSLDVSGDAWTQSAFAENNAVAWRTAPAGEKPYRVEGGIELVDRMGGPAQGNLLLGRTGTGFVSVAFTAGYGVTILRYDSGTDRWTTLGREAVAAVRTGPVLPFAVRVAKDRLAVEVDGRAVLEVSAGDHPLSGPWGVGAQAAATVRWHAVTLR